MELLASCISKSYEIDRNDISLNDPFHGGYITKTYGNNSVPWIQVEMNRDLYLSDPWFDKETLTVDLAHLQKLNEQFENSLNLFFKEFDGVNS
jgi:formiminoglutamase